MKPRILLLLAALGWGSTAGFGWHCRRQVRSIRDLENRLASLRLAPERAQPTDPSAPDPRSSSNPDEPAAEPERMTPQTKSSGVLPDTMKTELISALIHGDPSRPWQGLRELGFSLSGDDFRRALDGIGSDPKGFGEMQNVLKKWVDYDPRGASEWISAHLDQERIAGAIRSVASQWSGKSPLDASAWVRSLPAGPLKDIAVEHIAANLAKIDLNSAMDTLAWVSDEGRKAQITGAIAAEYVGRDVQAAADWIEGLPPGRGRDLAVERLVQNMAGVDPVVALEWAETIEDSQLVFIVLPTIATQWAKGDPAGAEDWVRTLAPGRARDLTVEAFSREIGQSDPEIGIEWAETIEGDVLRLSAVYRVASQWLISDPDAAAAWIASADIPDATRQALLRGK